MNIMEALGIPDPKGPTKASPEVERSVMQLAVKYLLYERSQPNEVVMALAQIVEERHKEFHGGHTYHEGPKMGEQVPVSECSNYVCKEACAIIARSEKMEVNINSFSLDLMARYNINFMPMPNNIRVWIVKNENSLPATDSEKKDAHRIIIPD